MTIGDFLIEIRPVSFLARELVNLLHSHDPTYYNQIINSCIHTSHICISISISADPLAKLEGEATGKDKTNANSFDLLFSFH